MLDEAPEIPAGGVTLLGGAFVSAPGRPLEFHFNSQLLHARGGHGGAFLRPSWRVIARVQRVAAGVRSVVTSTSKR